MCVCIFVIPCVHNVLTISLEFSVEQFPKPLRIDLVSILCAVVPERIISWLCTQCQMIIRFTDKSEMS